ncbi:GGDEF domain-containing protein [Pseudaminobacter sp. 19-2017]|uniref:diguanylate cyclase n=1 Tax=Pseudaminobacter soli (ex Zhang et al. 2022) TaxID=2831468 RepID=A0A942DVW3_9HYPH|nr:GGDEF domain-containing protein [Pseudaminobacter soli]MBS3647881.1 GGDEF domain-containing protein [Pseudaminobacter soli]
MSGAGFILAINIAVAGLLASAFVTAAVFDSRNEAPRWFATAYLTAVAYFIVEFVIYAFVGGPAMAVFSFSVFLAALAAFNVGLALKHHVNVPWTQMGVVFIASVILCAAIQDLPRTSVWRMLAYQSPYFVMQGIGVVIIGRARYQTRLDIILQSVLAASALHFLSKAFFLTLAGGTGATIRDYLDTNYALISQTLGTVFGLAVALLTLLMLVRDIVLEATKRSEMDTLSGLLNRGGFERHGAAALERCLARGLPSSLVVVDLDHFKSVNDTYGHAVGDRVIEALAGLLKTASSSQVAARLGGEEFAILLPGSNLATARLYAEGLRSAFSALSVKGLPENVRFTASFGVAELIGSEDLAALSSRADMALYAAKRAGRDCVRMAKLYVADEVAAVPFLGKDIA